MFQRDSSHVLRIWKVKSGKGFITTVTLGRMMRSWNLTSSRSLNRKRMTWS